MKTTDRFNLGRFIRVRERGDGRHHVFMSIPKHLRPEGWPATITLPESGQQSGTLDDEKFRASVVRDARRLNGRLDERRRRAQIENQAGRRTARALAEIYCRTQRYRDLSDSRKYRNKRDALIFAQWVEEKRGDRDFADLTKPDFEDFLSIYDDKKSMQLDLRSILNVLCKEAIGARWVTYNPVESLSWTAPPPKDDVVLWKDENSKAFISMARQMGQPGLAALMEVGLRVGQRLGDLRTAKHGLNYAGGRLRMRQEKTGAKVNLNLPKQLCELIESAHVAGSPYLFNDADTGTGFTASRLTARFNEVRHAVTADGAPKLLLRTLRHSAVCNMVDADVPLRKISAVTGHKLQRVHQIMERYAIDTEGFADDAMLKVHLANGGSKDDFASTHFGADRDWDGDGSAKAIYRAPKEDPARPGRYLAASIGQHRFGYTLPKELAEWPDEADELVEAI